MPWRMFLADGGDDRLVSHTGDAAVMLATLSHRERGSRIGKSTGKSGIAKNRDYIQISLLQLLTENDLADGVGFEPTSRFHGCRFSRPVYSTALPPIRVAARENFAGFGSPLTPKPGNPDYVGKTLPNMPALPLLPLRLPLADGYIVRRD